MTLAKNKRRLLWVEPETAHKILGHDRYWNLEFLGLYLNHCDETRWVDPAAAEQLVEPAALLVDKIRDLPPAQRHSWRARALSLQAEAVAMVGDLARAKALLAEAGSHLVKTKVPKSWGAEHFRRRGAVARLQGRADEAVDWLQRAEALYRELGNEPRGLAETLVLLGRVHMPAAIVGVAEVTAMVKPETQRKLACEPRLFDEAWWLLEQNMDHPGVGPYQLEACLDWLLRAYRQRLKSQCRALRRARLIWAEGRILHRLELNRRAAVRLRAAWKCAGTLGELDLATRIALDRVLVYRADDEPAKAREVIEETRELVSRRGGAPPELLERMSRAAGSKDLRALRREISKGFSPFTGGRLGGAKPQSQA